MFHSDLTTNGQITFDAAVGEEACFEPQVKCVTICTRHEENPHWVAD